MDGAPPRVKRAWCSVGAGGPVEQAALVRANVVEGLDDVEQGDLTRVARQAEAAPAASSALEDALRDERSKDLSEKRGRNPGSLGNRLAKLPGMLAARGEIGERTDGVGRALGDHRAGRSGWPRRPVTAPEPRRGGSPLRPSGRTPRTPGRAPRTARRRPALPGTGHPCPDVLLARVPKPSRSPSLPPPLSGGRRIARSR